MGKKKNNKPSPSPKGARVPGLTKKNVIHLFTQRRESKLAWVPKTNLWIILHATERKNKNWWYINSACSRQMTKNRKNFFSLKAYEEESAGFEYGKKGDIISIGKVRKSHSHGIKNIYYNKGLKHNLLSVSQMYDKGNHILFTSTNYMVTNGNSGNWFSKAKRHKINYKVDYFVFA